MLGLLNSSLLWYFIRGTSNPYRGSYYYFKTKYLEPFSIPDAPLSVKKSIGKLVKQIIAKKERDSGADVSLYEREIDEQVYRLYELSPKEIDTVLNA